MQQRIGSICCKISRSPVWKRSFAWMGQVENSSEPRYDDEYGWMISISSRKAITVNEVSRIGGKMRF